MFAFGSAVAWNPAGTSNDARDHRSPRAPGLSTDRDGPAVCTTGAAAHADAASASAMVTTMLRVGSIVLRVDDLERQAEFWEAALDYVRRGEGDDETFILLRPRNGEAPNVSLDRVRSNLPIPPRIHLDLYTEDQAREVKRLLALGATEVHWDKRPPDADYVILADPEGNRFCVVDVTR